MSEDGPMAETTDSGVQVVDEGPCKKRLVAEIPAERVTEKVEAQYRELRKNVQMPGFRTGKVPRTVLQRKYGEQIEAEVKDELLQEAFRDQIEQNELHMVGEPDFGKVEFKVGEPFVFEATFEVAPTFDLPEYKGLKIDAQPVTVSDDEVDKELQQLIDQSASWEGLAEGEPPAEGDVAFLSMRIEIEGADDYEREGLFVKLGEDRVDDIPAPGISEKLLAAKAGDAVEITVTLPDTFEREELREQEHLIHLTAKDFRRESKPEVDDTFASRFGVETADELRKSIREGVETRLQRTEDRRQEDELVAHIVDNLDMDLPQGVLERETEQLRVSRTQDLVRQGKSKEDAEVEVAADTKVTGDAERALREGFAMNKIAEDELILVTEDEIAARIGEMAQLYQTSPAQLFEEYRKRGMLHELRNGLLMEKVREFLRKKAIVSGAAGDDTAGAE